MNADEMIEIWGSHPLRGLTRVRCQIRNDPDKPLEFQKHNVVFDRTYISNLTRPEATFLAAYVLTIHQSMHSRKPWPVVLGAGAGICIGTLAPYTGVWIAIGVGLLLVAGFRLWALPSFSVLHERAIREALSLVPDRTCAKNVFRKAVESHGGDMASGVFLDLMRFIDAEAPDD
jgi:hypothetical protein